MSQPVSLYASADGPEFQSIRFGEKLELAYVLERRPTRTKILQHRRHGELQAWVDTRILLKAPANAKPAPMTWTSSDVMAQVGSHHGAQSCDTPFALFVETPAKSGKFALFGQLKANVDYVAQERSDATIEVEVSHTTFYAAGSKLFTTKEHIGACPYEAK